MFRETEVLGLKIQTDILQNPGGINQCGRGRVQGKGSSTRGNLASLLLNRG